MGKSGKSIVNPTGTMLTDRLFRKWQDVNALDNLVRVLARAIGSLSQLLLRPIRYSSNHAASGTTRFGATIDVEMNHVRFLGSVVLNLWDCGGQEAFMDAYLTRQRNTIFSDVGVLIYVFDVESRDTERDLGYYIDCLDACRKNSPEAEIFVLLHKMDLCEHRRDPVAVFNAKRQELLKYGGGSVIKMFPTSIYNESLYRVSNYHTLLSCGLPLAQLFRRLGHELFIH